MFLMNMKKCIVKVEYSSVRLSVKQWNINKYDYMSIELSKIETVLAKDVYKRQIRIQTNNYLQTYKEKTKRYVGYVLSLIHI